MNRYFKLVCLSEKPEWYLEEFFAGRVRFGWSGPSSDLRYIREKRLTDWDSLSNDQKVTWQYSQFLVERIVPGDRVVVQTEQPLRSFLIAEVVAPGYEFSPGDLDDFNHLLHSRPLTSRPIPINSIAVSAALKHDLSKRGNHYEIYPKDSVEELDHLVQKVDSDEIDLIKIRTDADTLDHTWRDTKRGIIREISRKWPSKNFERFCEALLRKIDNIEVKELRDNGKGWDLLIRIVNPITKTILLDDVPVQCKNFTGEVTSHAPIDDLARCVKNSGSHVAYLFILGQLSKTFLEELRVRQEVLVKELGRPVVFEVVNEDRIAEIYTAYLNNFVQDRGGSTNM